MFSLETRDPIVFSMLCVSIRPILATCIVIFPFRSEATITDTLSLLTPRFVFLSLGLLYGFLFSFLLPLSFMSNSLSSHSTMPENPCPLTFGREDNSLCLQSKTVLTFTLNLLAAFLIVRLSTTISRYSWNFSVFLIPDIAGPVKSLKVLLQLLHLYRLRPL